MTETSNLSDVFRTDIDLPNNYDDPTPSSVRRRASERAFGSIIGSKSIKPVHLANVVFSHVTGGTTDMSGFKEFVADGDTEHEENSPTEWIAGTPTDEKLNTLQDAMILIYDNDDGFYADSSNAPTCTSSMLLDRSTGFITTGRFLYEVLTCADGAEAVTSLLEEELEDRSDSLSLLARPALHSADRKPRTTTLDRKTLDNPFEEGKTAQSISNGFIHLSKYFERSQLGVEQAVSDLRFAIKFGGFGLYVYLLNRHEELQAEIAATADEDEVNNRGRFPIVLNYAARDQRSNNILQASYDSYERGKKEIQKAANIGLEAQLDHITLDADALGDHLSNERIEELTQQPDDNERESDKIPLTSLSEEAVRTLIEDQLFPEIVPGSNILDFDRFLARFDTRTADTLEERLIEAYRFAMRRDSFAGSEVYPITGGVRNLIRRLGLLKPFGPWAKHRWFRPDPELLIPIVLSVVTEPEGQEGVGLTRVCDRLLDQYGIVVGGTERDRAHLQKWEISFGSAPDYEATFDYNFEQFKQELISLGYAQEYSDGVTYIYSKPFLQE